MYRKILATAILAAALIGCGEKEEEVINFNNSRIAVVENSKGQDVLTLNGRPFTGVVEREIEREMSKYRYRFKKGIQHGVTESYHIDYGYLQKEITYKKGKVTGPYRDYTRYIRPERHFLSIEGQYLDGEVVGIWRHYDEHGNIKRELDYDED